MTNEERFVSVALNAWNGNIERADKLFSGLTAEQLTQQVAPGKNRLIYLWGHLTAVHDAMLPLLAFGPRLHPEFRSRRPRCAMIRNNWEERGSRKFPDERLLAS
jgi:hypothetical protein